MILYNMKQQLNFKPTKPMTTYYERKEATELPKESGNYPTDVGIIYYCAIEKNWWLNDKKILLGFPSYYFVIQPSPIPSMTLEEARQKNRIVNKDKYKSLLKETMSPEAVSIVVENDFAELYLTQNTLSLKQELEGLKEKLKQSEYNLLVVSETAADLEQRANILTEALVSIANIAQSEANVPVNGNELQSGKQQAYSRMYFEIKTALSLTK